MNHKTKNWSRAVSYALSICTISIGCAHVGPVPTMTVWQAAETGNTEQLRLHVAARTDFNARNADGRAPLHVATLALQPKAVEFLASHGADVHAPEPRIGWTVLHNEVLNGHLETARLLIAMGADVNALDTGRRAPIIWAAGGGQLPAVELLLDRGADIMTRTAADWTPLHVAAAIAYGEMMELMLQRGATVDASDEKGQTPLHYSAGKGHAAGAALLIRHGADVNAKDNEGKRPLDLATDEGVRELLKQAAAIDNGATE